MPRLDIERQERLEPKRLAHAIDELTKKRYTVTSFAGKRIEFEFNGYVVKFYPYSGWASGKSIKDGRGLIKLLKQV